jgi:hypothetical protein
VKREFAVDFHARVGRLSSASVPHNRWNALIVGLPYPYGVRKWRMGKISASIIFFAMGNFSPAV